MSDIDFLGHKKNDKDEADTGVKKPEPAWSEPEKPAKAAAAFSFLPFKKKPKPTEAKAAGPLDYNKIKESRREILRLIDSHESARPKSGKGKNFLSALGGKLKKRPGHKEVMIDYQRVFNQEKEKKNNAGLIFNRQPEAAAQAPRPKAANRASWLDGLKKLIKSSPRLSSASLKINPPEQEKKITASRPAEEIARPVIIPDKPQAEPARRSEPTAPEPISQDPAEEKNHVLETNLINEEIVAFFDWQEKITPLVSAILLPVIAVIAIYYGVSFYEQSSRSKNLDQAQKLKELDSAIALEEPGVKEIKSFGDKLKITNQIFQQHLYWTNFFKFLEDNTIKNVYYTDFSGDTGGNYQINALAASYGDIEEQVRVLKNNKYVTGAEASGGEITSGDEKKGSLIKFILNFSVAKSIFTD